MSSKQHNKAINALSPRAISAGNKIKLSIRGQAFISHLPPIGRGQARLARPYPGGLFEKAAAAWIRTLDPETAASYLTALGTHGQPGHLSRTIKVLDCVSWHLMIVSISTQQARASISLVVICLLSCMSCPNRINCAFWTDHLCEHANRRDEHLQMLNFAHL